jgi:hypothetical protein
MNYIDYTIIVLSTILLVYITYVSVLVYYNDKPLEDYYYKIHFENVQDNIVANRNTTIKPISNKIVFVSFHTYDKVPDYAHYTTIINKGYCHKHNYEYIMKPLQKDKISPYWVRVFEIKNMLNDMNDGDIVVYTDLDACVNPKWFDLRIEEIIQSLKTISNNKDFHMYVGSDPIEANFKYKNTLNTGVMIVENNTWTRKLFEIWGDMYDKRNWIYNNGWHCRTNVGFGCKWAGDEYEQGSLNILYTKNILKSSTHICKLHYSIMSNMNFNKDSFIFHIMGTDNNKRLEFFRKLYREYKKL